MKSKSPFLDETVACLKQYFKDNDYRIITDNIHGMEPHWRVVCVKMRIWPTGTAPRDAQLRIHASGLIVGQSHEPHAYFRTDIHDPDSFPKIEQFLAKVFP